MAATVKTYLPVCTVAIQAGANRLGFRRRRRNALPHDELLRTEIGKFVCLRDLPSDWLATATNYPEK